MAVIRKSDAIISLDTNCKFSVKNNDVVTFADDTYDNPTDAEINAEVTRLQAIEDYQAPRRAEYPSIANQLDDIYHNGIDAWKATIKTTKDKYPKP
jgi:hypothetical protein|tara:strand:- start:9 stop:296 length:288 start_codon:yes stop_codon:yes gene_type:complete